MAMGFGCNAAGVVAARIIDSPRERMIAIITNNFVPCNGRFPLLISLSAIFLGGQVVGAYGNALASLVVVALVLVGITVTLLVSWALSKTLLRGYRPPFPWNCHPIDRRRLAGCWFAPSLIARCLSLGGRSWCAPAGAITWILANSYVGELSVLAHAARWLEPFGRALGLDGYIILAFLLGLPANEIVIPILIMSYLGAGGNVGTRQY